MAKIAQSIRQRRTELAESGVDLREQQVDYAVKNGLARLDDPPEKWEAIASIRRGSSLRMPEADEAAIELAFAGAWCDRLPEALIRFGAVKNERPEQRGDQSAAEAEAEQFMAQAGTGGDERDKPYGAKLAGRLLNHAATDDPWPERHPGVAAAEDVDLHKLGRSQSVATDLAEVADGKPAEITIDTADASAVTGFDAGHVSMTARWLDGAFGGGWLAGMEDMIRNAEPDDLVAATKAANDLRPIYERVVVSTGNGDNRWRVLAAIVPVMLALPDLLSELDRDPRLFTELLEATPPGLLADTLVSSLPVAEAPPETD
jgi:hypothetical protein